jgi:hypothetical protein
MMAACRRCRFPRRRVSHARGKLVVLAMIALGLILGVTSLFFRPAPPARPATRPGTTPATLPASMPATLPAAS